MKKGEERKKWAGQALFFAAAVFLGAALFLWFREGGRWEFFGFRLSLHHWQKPWWIAAALLILRSLIAPAPLWVNELVATLFARLNHRFGLDFRRLGGPGPGALWTTGGILVGAVAGFFFSLHYQYLFPGRAAIFAFLLLASFLSALVHFGFYVAVSAGLRQVMPAISTGQLAVRRTAVYFLLWSLLLTGPLRLWEARFTEPVFLQAAGGTCLGVLFFWWWASRFGRVRMALAAAILFLLLVSDHLPARTEDPPGDRVIFITLDTVRADHLSCYGYNRATSPHLDALSRTGVRFTRAFAPTAATDPSHLSMFTGVYPRTHGVKIPMAGKLPRPLPSFPERFRDRGFATMAITSRLLLDPERLGLPGFSQISVPRLANTSAAEAVRRARLWLAVHRHENIFLWIHFFDPHQPYTPHPGFTGRFTLEERKEKSGDKWLDPGERYTDEEIKYRIDLYDGEIAYMDHYLGRLLEVIAHLDPPSKRPPLIIVLADHGEMLAEKQDPPIAYGFGHGGVLYQPAVHIPLIISWPGIIPAGVVREETVEVMDLAPTLTELVLREEFKGQGKSLAPLLLGAGSSGPTGSSPAILERDQAFDFPRPFLEKEQYAVLHWPFKLFITQGGEVELYDLSRDPGETENLADRLPESTAELMAFFEEWQKKTPETKPLRRPLSPGEREKLRALGYIQ